PTTNCNHKTTMRTFPTLSLSFTTTVKINCICCYLVFGHVHVHDRPRLQHELPQQLLVHPLVQVAHVGGGLLVALLDPRTHPLIIVASLLAKEQKKYPTDTSVSLLGISTYEEWFVPCFM